LIQTTPPDPILWIGNVFPTESEVNFDGKTVELKKLNWTQSFSEFLKSSYSLIVAEISEKGQLDILENMRLPDPQTWVGVYLRKASPETVRRALNSSKIKFVVDGDGDLASELVRNLRSQEKQRRQNFLLREYYQRNKKLESLTADLERIVMDRTFHLEQSNKDQSEKNQLERNLIRFIKEIASFAAVEDVLVFLRKEFRKFHNVSEPLLCLQYGKGSQIFYFRTSGVQKVTFPKDFEFFKNKEFDAPAASRELANLLARPIAKGSFFTMSLDLLTQFYEMPAKALLFFEHSLADSKEFETFAQERINPISISLDRILLEQELDIFSYRWEKTFDGIKDPVAIIDVNSNVLRSNKKFANLNKDQRIYEIRKYPIRIQPDENPTSFVHQYIDLTEAKDLRLRLLQHEKMGALGTLAGHIAHELNNPLTGIRSLAQVLSSEVTEEQLKSDLHEIESSAARCQRIIKNLLEFSQDQESDTETVSLDEIVERTLPMLKTALRSHRMELDLKTKDEKIEVFSHLLQQVVFNLVNNACQAMKNPGEVSITTKSEKDYLELEIADTGHGIPDEIKANIFEPFFTTKPASQGTGLGLSIAKTIVERCGGKISFESESGKGTKFFLRFPKNENPNH
jgi:signal transduction histidine kinase